VTAPQAGVSTVNPRQAYAMLENDPTAVLVDVRSTMEFLMVGHPVGAIHISWLDEPDFTPNPQFVRQVRELMLGGAICEPGQGCPPILLICRSGRRSLEAGHQLAEAGLREIYNIAGGFEGPLDDHHRRSTVAGWRFEGLPWEQC